MYVSRLLPRRIGRGAPRHPRRRHATDATRANIAIRGDATTPATRCGIAGDPAKAASLQLASVRSAVPELNVQVVVANAGCGGDLTLQALDLALQVLGVLDGGEHVDEQALVVSQRAVRTHLGACPPRYLVRGGVEDVHDLGALVLPPLDQARGLLVLLGLAGAESGLGLLDHLVELGARRQALGPTGTRLATSREITSARGRLLEEFKRPLRSKCAVFVDQVADLRQEVLASGELGQALQVGVIRRHVLELLHQLNDRRDADIVGVAPEPVL